MFRIPLTTLLALSLVMVIASPRDARAVIAYDIPFGTTGHQNFGGALGMDFNVIEPITITQLGVFDDDSNGLAAPITAFIYPRNAGNTTAPIARLVFPAGTPGTLVGGHRFLDLPVPLELPAGFQGVIVASGYNAVDNNGNAGAGTVGMTTNSGGGLISFVGTSRFNANGQLFPSTPDGGPANRYAAGSFEFKAGSFEAVTLQNATAILSQPNFNVSLAIDNLIAPDAQFGGWANSALGNNTAVFETTTDLGGNAGTELQFRLSSGGFTNHTLGRFRLSVTTDDRSLFADSLQNGGDVDANWIVLDVDSITSTNATTTFTELADGSILAGGGIANVETYLLNATTSITGITGIRIEMLEDASFPGAGPGRASNGNYVLLEMAVTARDINIPEPASALLLGLGAMGLIARRRRVA